ncbi:MAG: hypothetical protein ACK5BN_19780 [Planctomycetota bacterium]
MSGPNSNDDDFLDDEFVVEGLADQGPRDDLGLLFTPADQPPPPPTAPAATPDADDNLFTDHTANLNPTEVFDGRQQFDEAAASTWDGANLDLDDHADGLAAQASGAETPKAPATPDWGDADAFADDAASVDSALEIVGQPSAATPPDASTATPEISVSGLVDEEMPVLDPVAEGEDLPWLLPVTTVGENDTSAPADGAADVPMAANGQFDAAAAAADATVTVPADAAPRADAPAATDKPSLQDALFGDGTGADLVTPAANAEEQPAEGEEFAASEEAFAAEEQPAEGDEFAASEGAFAAEEQPAEGEEFAASEEAYAAEEQPAAAELIGVSDDGSLAPVLAGPGSRGSRMAMVFAGLAASCAIVAGAGIVLLRPELVGLDLGPAQVAQVRVERPALPELVAAPPPVVHSLVQVPAKPNDPAAKPGLSAGAMTKLFGALSRLGGKRSGAGTPTATEPPTLPPVAVVNPPLPPFPAGGPVANLPPAQPPVGQASQRPATGEPSWPAPVTSGAPTGTAPPARAGLVRLDADTMVGDNNPDDMVRKPVDGVMPGLRAFALMRNGNFFIGRVKMVDEAALTLRTPDGEVSLLREELERVVGLGTADYETLQRATDGFVRLTNSNKLIGGILSQVADDHVVMEWRSNRIILPRSAVGSIVKGQQPDDVQFRLSPEEDAWLRRIAQRELSKDRETTQPKRPTDVPPGAEPGK